MIYFLKTPLFHIQREIFRTLPTGKVRLAERRVTQSRALPTYSAHRCRCSSIGLHSAVYAVNINLLQANFNRKFYYSRY